MKCFNPHENVSHYRRALSRFATGIAVVTASGPDGPTAITVNSFASVSLDPPLILWSPDKASRRHDVFAQATHFAVHIMAAHQRDICQGFVKSAFAFDTVETVMNASGVPVIQNCLAVFECRQHAAIDAGDHTILIGEVLSASEQPGEALIYANGAYGKVLTG